jgi:TnpA family transposase
VALNKRLKNLLDEDITTMDFDLQKSLQDSRKYIDSVTNGRRDDYDDLLKQIQKISKKVNDDIHQENGRL